jgi:predicted DsbA family dithiol-disulfide isomerase
MTEKIAVDVWSDPVCPWCYLGKRRFEQALDRFEHRDHVEVRWRSFELDPSAPKTDPPTLPERMQNVLGLPAQEAEYGITYITGLAKEVGLDYHLCDARPVNSMDAHRLLHFATAHGKGDELRERLSNAYCGEGVNIGDHETLLSLAEQVGLDRAEAADVLRGDAYSAEVAQDVADARRVGVMSVPTFLFGGAYLAAGACSTEELHGALKRTWADANR